MLVIINTKACTIYQGAVKTTVKNEEAILKITNTSCVVVEGELIGQAEMIYIDGDNDAYFQKKLKQLGIAYEIVRYETKE